MSLNQEMGMSRMKNRKKNRGGGDALQPTADEIAYDRLVVEALNNGMPIQAALSFAGTRYPAEALQWTDEDLDGISAHYEFLRNNIGMIDVFAKTTFL